MEPRDPGKTNRIPLPVTTTSDEQKKFTERLKKYKGVSLNTRRRDSSISNKDKRSGATLSTTKKNVSRNVNEKLEKGQEQLFE